MTITFNKHGMARMTLRDLPPGVPARITGVRGGGDVLLRLMEMGLVRGTTVTVQKVAPLGDPMELAVRGYALSIRASEAERFEVEALGS